VSRSFSPHETDSDDEPVETGSNRAFGRTVGTVAMAIGAVKAMLAATVTPVSLLIFGAGAVLFLFGLIAPARLSLVKRLWLQLGAAMAKLVNPIILALLFIVVITPLAFVMRLSGKRPLRLAPDPTASSYWLPREPTAGGPPDMRRQF
jgi:saxitoxin biosynthesis operon SxtJ-like protein